MADFNWTFTPGTGILAAILGVVGWGGRKWIRQQIDNSLKIDNTQKLQDLATASVERIDARNVILEARIESDRVTAEETQREISSLREYLLRDAVWHIQVLAEIKNLGGEVPIAPEVPPRQREFRSESA